MKNKTTQNIRPKNNMPIRISFLWCFIFGTFSFHSFSNSLSLFLFFQCLFCILFRWLQIRFDPIQDNEIVYFHSTFEQMTSILLSIEICTVLFFYFFICHDLTNYRKFTVCNNGFDASEQLCVYIIIFTYFKPCHFYFRSKKKNMF